MDGRAYSSISHKSAQVSVVLSAEISLGRMILCSVVLRSYTLIPKASISLHEDRVKQTLRTQKSQFTFPFFNKIMS